MIDSMDSDSGLGAIPSQILSRSDRDILAGQMLAFETVTRRLLPVRQFAVIRVDGKSFSSYTQGLTKPFDEKFADDMDTAALALMTGMQGAVGAFVVSDEISVILTDLTSEEAQPMFSWNEAKLVSIAASIVTAAFNAHRDPANPGLFDARVFTLPDRETVQQYLAYRQGDGVRNAISTVARLQYGKTSVEGVGATTLKRRLDDDKVPVLQRHSLGRFIHRVEEERTVTFTHSRTGTEETITVQSSVPRLSLAPVFLESSSDWLPTLVDG